MKHLIVSLKPRKVGSSFIEMKVILLYHVIDGFLKNSPSDSYFNVQKTDWWGCIIRDSSRSSWSQKYINIFK